MKAFLSHSSADKPFVEEVAHLLGRQHYLLDKHQFEIGQDFKEEIVRCLEIADTFVLFASHKALKSPWVTYEMDLAEDRRLAGALSDALVFLLDGVTHADLTPWLTRGLVIEATSPRAVAREIGVILDKRLGAKRPAFMFGRGTERDRISKALHPLGAPLPRVIALWGLPGIGRRTLMDDVARGFLNFKHFVPLEIESGDNINDVAFKLAADWEFYPDVSALKALGDKIRAESEPDAKKRLAKYITTATTRGFICLHDLGGLLDDAGDATPACRALLDAAAQERGVYLGMIFRRLPVGLLGAQAPHGGIVCEHVKPLGQADVEQLLVKLLDDQEIPYDAPQVKALAELVRGYPPAAYYAVDIAQREGFDLLLSAPRPVINFRSRVLAACLDGVDAGASTSRVLQYLAFYSPLPLSVLGECTELDPDALASALGSLLHASIAEVTEEGLYRISEPLVEVAQHRFGRWAIPHDRVASALAKFVGDFGIGRGGLTTLRGLFRARTLAGTREEDSEIAFPADLIRLTGDFYHERQYERSVEIGQHAIELRPENVDARSFVVRAYAQLGNFAAAYEQVEGVRQLGNLKEYYFLMGFVSRHESKPREAITNYEEALRRGRKGVAIRRELASCYFYEGNLEKAREHLDVARIAGDRPNRYVIDLLVTIATVEGDEVAARNALAELEQVDERPFYLHRASTVEYRFANYHRARDLAREAVSLTVRPTFAMLSQQIKCEIATDDLGEAAAHLVEAERRFGARRRDVVLGLRCKWELASGQYDNADAMWQKISEKGKPVHQALRRDVVAGLLRIRDPNSPTYQSLRDELAILDQTVGTIAWDVIDEGTA